MRSLVFASLAMAATLSQAVAPQKPDFSGTWTMDGSRSESPGGVVLDIRHTPTEISIETTRAGTTSKRTYPLEPSPQAAKETITAGHSHSYWNGTELVTEASGEIQGQTVSFKQTHALNPAGTEMTVNSLVIVQHGYSLEGGKNYGTAKDVYVRAK